MPSIRYGRAPVAAKDAGTSTRGPSRRAGPSADRAVPSLRPVHRPVVHPEPAEGAASVRRRRAGEAVLPFLVDPALMDRDGDGREVWLYSERVRVENITEQPRLPQRRA